MPFCSQCGNQVGERDAYCASCGTRQAVPAAGKGKTTDFPDDVLTGVAPRTLAVLCYIPFVGVLASIVVLASRRFRSDITIRFHAFQGLYLFAAHLVVQWAIKPMFMATHMPFRPDHLLQALIVFVWIFMLVKTSQGQVYALPVIGELAQRSAEER